MRIVVLMTIACVGCATADPAASGEDSTPVRSSVVHLEGGGDPPSRVVRLQAGAVRVSHVIPSTARLRATTLEGLDPANRHLKYEWDRDGTYTVTAPGRYRHSVSGSIVGGGRQRLTSRLTYTPLPDSVGGGTEAAALMLRSRGD